MGNSRKPGVIGISNFESNNCRLPVSTAVKNPLGFKTSCGETQTVSKIRRRESRSILPGPTGWTYAYPLNPFAIELEETCSASLGKQNENNDDREEYLKVMKGQLTFDAEGNDDPKSIYFSRKPHVPSATSGVTIGRGYDMKEKSSEKIKDELVEAGVSEELAEKFSKASGKQGEEAEKFLEEQKLKETTISRKQQKELFDITYSEIEKDVKRICSKADVEKAYGKTDWPKLNPKIMNVLVDLRFRGDYTPSSRKLLQKHVSKNELKNFKEVICKHENWSSVPKDRFNRRCNYLKK